MPYPQARTEILIGAKGLARLRTARVLIAGLGGVGGHVAEALGRAGIGRLTLLDHDVVSPSNLNRQLLALHSTLGRPKIEVMAERLRDIDPTLELTLIGEFLQPDGAESLVSATTFDVTVQSPPLAKGGEGGFGSRHLGEIPPAPLFSKGGGECLPFDYVADCIDSIACKAALVAACHRHGVPVVSALGAGNCLDVRRVQVATLNQTHVCPLARELRRQLRERGAPLNYPVVYSDELRRPPLPHQPVSSDTPGRPRAVNGTISYMPALFGVMLAGVVIQRLLAGVESVG
ncbi:MAG: tRNA threonylcarbamoyladenosine dehydratase [Candidatus Competibacteraceae bacterium]|nr:tRNA threonylcarbamoyladenosine dehydratase [Candidatus Competibacteraceae bacterium]MCP5125362.1 tRNA threonylcarbamoyladenosine dehydratase [Gammaproteobacteria bacterium]HRX70267.1 tRNA threonylcarbamoyladenosine dehydratase [Candidatus Competibacteraceae bacterium]